MCGDFCIVSRDAASQKRPTTLCAGWVELYNAANNLKFALPVEREAEAEKLVSVLKEQNAGQGPGYTVVGIVVRSSTVWTLAGGMLSLVAGAGISVIRDAESNTSTTGSFGA